VIDAARDADLIAADILKAVEERFRLAIEKTLP
jgi:hypothetical protein